MIKFITTQEVAQRALEALSRMDIMAVDTETTGLDPHRDKLVLLQAGDELTQFVFDCRQVDVSILKPLLEGEAPLKVLHNAKFDYQMIFSSCGVRLERIVDTMLIEKLLTNGLPKESHGLKDLAWKYLKEPMSKEMGTSFLAGVPGGDITREQVEYAARDVEMTYRMFLEQMRALIVSGQERVARIECDAISAFADMEFEGMLIDERVWKKLAKESEVHTEEIRDEMDKLFSKVCETDLFGKVLVNYDSDDQVKNALNALGLNVPDTNRATLDDLDHPAARVLTEYRKHQKVVSTYGVTFLNHVHSVTGRIHPEFRQLGASSGRATCAKPNLQNIKGDAEFRACFVARSGYSIITADYAGCELRIIAELSGDPGFIEAFQNKQDLHSVVASKVFGVSVSKTVNPELRARAKGINFGLAYGMGVPGFAKATGTSMDEAEKLLQSYYAAYPLIQKYLNRSSATSVSRGWCETIAGRRLHLRGNNDSGELTRTAKNMPIQGTNADMTKLALTKIRRRLLDEQKSAHIVNMVHDEILVECKAEETEDVCVAVREEMVGAGEDLLKRVPIEVDMTVDRCWRH